MPYLSEKDLEHMLSRYHSCLPRSGAMPQHSFSFNSKDAGSREIRYCHHFFATNFACVTYGCEIKNIILIKKILRTFCGFGNLININADGLENFFSSFYRKAAKNKEFMMSKSQLITKNKYDVHGINKFFRIRVKSSIYMKIYLSRV